MSAPSQLIVGLGNPGPEYIQTRHNVGWMVVEEMVLAAGAAEISADKFEARLLRDGSTLLVQPLTYMNRSGPAVRAVADYYKIPPAQLLVLTDDLDLPFGAWRYRAEGGSGGHKGLQSIIETYATNAIPRLRIGIGRPPLQMEAADYVLSRFSPGEEAALPALLQNVIAEVAERLDEGSNHEQT